MGITLITKIKTRVQQQRNAKTISKSYQINLHIHMQNYKHLKPIKGHLKVVFGVVVGAFKWF